MIALACWRCCRSAAQREAARRRAAARARGGPVCLDRRGRARLHARRPGRRLDLDVGLDVGLDVELVGLDEN